MKISRDLLGGSLFLLLGIGTIIVSSSYDFGTPRRPGAGLMPMALGLLLVLFSAMTIVRDRIKPGPLLEAIAFRSVFVVLAAILAFGLLLAPLGLPLAIVATVLIGSFASSSLSIIGALILGVGLAAASTVLFVVLLGQNMPILGFLFSRMGA